MNRTSLYAGIVIAIIILIGIIVVLPNTEKHQTPTSTVLPPTSLPFTTTITATTSNKSSIMTQSSTTQTPPSKLQPDALYLLNYSDGDYWYVAVVNVTFPATPITVATNNGGHLIHEYHLYNYTELMFCLNTEITSNTTLTIALSNGEVVYIPVVYAGVWTFENI